MSAVDPNKSSTTTTTTKTRSKPPASSKSSSASKSSVDRFEKNPMTLADGHLSREVKGLEAMSFKYGNGNGNSNLSIKQGPNLTLGKKGQTKTHKQIVQRRRVPHQTGKGNGKGVVKFANGFNTARQGVVNVWNQNRGEGAAQIASGTADMIDAVPKEVKEKGTTGSRILKHAGPAAATVCALKDTSDTYKAVKKGDAATAIEESANVAAGIVGCTPAAPAAWTYTLLDAGMEVTGADKQMIKDLDRCFLNQETNLASQKQDVLHRSNARMLLHMKPSDRRALRGRNKREFAQGLQELKRQASQLENPVSRKKALQFIDLIKKDITVDRP